MEHPTNLKPPKCPECGRIMLWNGVMLHGNVLTGEESKPVGRWDCPNCEAILADSDIDQEWGWQQWVAQGNTRPAKATVKEYPFAASCYLADAKGKKHPGLIEYSRPQDFATNKAWHYHYLEVKQVDPFPALFKCHLYIDMELKTSDDKLNDQVFGLALSIIQAGVPDFAASSRATGWRMPSMSPTDCLDEDDFWDDELGEPPAPCDDDQDEDDQDDIL